MVVSAGKTTMVEKLTKKLNGQTMSTPPPCLHSLRDQFDGQPIVLRRAYYSLGNYIAAYEVEKVVQSCPVVMDRLVTFKVLVVHCFGMMNPH
jgi:UMP-CMP kinase 2